MSIQNPLDGNKIINMTMMNPNPSSSKTKNGPLYRVSFEVQHDDWMMFMDANTSGMVLNVALMRDEDCPGQVGESVFEDRKTPKLKGKYGDFAKWVYQSGLMRTPNIWKALGSEANHKLYIQSLPCVICGQYDFIDGVPRNEESHVRTASNSGTAIKPPYFSVPMCHEDHGIQHNNGYSMIISRYQKTNKKPINPDLESDWMLDELKKHAITYLEEWVKIKFYELFSIDSLTFLEPSALMRFIKLHEIEISIPARFLPPNELQDE